METDSVAQPPFDKDSEGDCIVKTSDGRSFYVHRIIMKIASPIFADMFGLPQPQNSLSIPTITVSEDSATVQALLECIYPIPQPTISTIEEAAALTFAAEKYFIPTSLLPLQGYLLSPDGPVLKHPTRVYALAWRLGLEDAARFASRYTHGVDITSREIRTQIIQDSGGFDAMAALYDFRLSREQAHRTMVTALYSAGTANKSCAPSPTPSPPLHFGMKASASNKSPTSHGSTNELGHLDEIVGVMASVLDRPMFEAEDLSISSLMGSVCSRCAEAARSVRTLRSYQRATYNFPQTITWPSQAASTGGTMQ